MDEKNPARENISSQAGEKIEGGGGGGGGGGGALLHIQHRKKKAHSN